MFPDNYSFQNRPKMASVSNRRTYLNGNHPFRRQRDLFSDLSKVIFVLIFILLVVQLQLIAYQMKSLTAAEQQQQKQQQQQQQQQHTSDEEINANTITSKATHQEVSNTIKPLQNSNEKEPASEFSSSIDKISAHSYVDDYEHQTETDEYIDSEYFDDDFVENENSMNENNDIEENGDEVDEEERKNNIQSSFEGNDSHNVSSLLIPDRYQTNSFI